LAFSIDDGEFPGAPGRPWVALPRTRRNLDPLSLLGRGSRVPSRRNCRFLKTPRDRYRSVLAREDPTRIPALKAERNDHAGADRGTRSRSNDSLDTGRRQVRSQELRLWQAH
jgi:hypothetical protein